MIALEDLRTEVRKQFPSLDVVTDVLLDNAGGSQMPAVVMGRIASYFRDHYVQLGADYDTSRHASAIVDEARLFVLDLFHGRDLGQAILGASTSTLCAMLADCFARAPVRGRDEIVISDGGHEANIGPWRRLESRGYKIRWWKVRDDGSSPLEDLRELLSPRTRILAVHHVSNLLGGVEDVAAWTRAAHEVGARVVVDGVAYAPHRAIDVAALGCDFYVFSLYKVYGPHMAAMFGRDEALAELEGPNHDFIARDDVPYKFELGGVQHEGCAGILGIRDYLRWLAAQVGGDRSAESSDRAAIEAAFASMQALEAPLVERLVSWVEDRSDLSIVGPSSAGPERVGTISFVADNRSSQSIAQVANAARLGIRYGHFYAPRLARAVGLEPDDGVVRTSFVHYSAPAEIEALIEHFEDQLAR